MSSSSSIFREKLVLLRLSASRYHGDLGLYVDMHPVLDMYFQWSSSIPIKVVFAIDVLCQIQLQTGLDIGRATLS